MAYQLLETLEVKRPSRFQDQWANVRDSELERAQAAWDEANQKDMNYNAVRLESVATQARKEAKRRADNREWEAKRQAEAEAPLIEKARSAFIRAGGSAEAFEANQTAIIEQVRTQIAVEAAVSAAKPGPRQTTEF